MTTNYFAAFLKPDVDTYTSMVFVDGILANEILRCNAHVNANHSDVAYVLHSTLNEEGDPAISTIAYITWWNGALSQRESLDTNLINLPDVPWPPPTDTPHYRVRYVSGWSGMQETTVYADYDDAHDAALDALNFASDAFGVIILQGPDPSSLRSVLIGPTPSNYREVDVTVGVEQEHVCPKRPRLCVDYAIRHQ